MRVIVRADDTTVFLCSVLSEMGSSGEGYFLLIPMRGW